MSQKKQLVFWIVGIAVLVLAAVLAYNFLVKQNGGAMQLSAATPTPAAAEGSDEAAATPTPTPQPAPNITVQDADGNSVSLADMKGKPVVLNFWASWCGPCQSEMPDFDEVAAELGDKVHFMMVNATDGNRETVDTAKAFIEKKGYTFPVYFDTDQSASYAYGVSGIPMTFFIDAAGNYVAHASGAISKEVLMRGIDMILPAAQEETAMTAQYHSMTQQEAYEILTSERADYMVVDVREQNEYDEGHIKGAKLIPYTQIGDRAATELPDKDQTILLYCRSGRRSQIAANTLVELGYTAVYDFGGMNDWTYTDLVEK